MEVVNGSSKLTPTSLTKLMGYAEGSVVELPAFGPDQPFVARLKRPSMLMLVKTGVIPNSLIAKASELFSNGSQALDPDDVDMMSQVFDICEVIARASLAEPTFDELTEAGIELTDEQLMFIFNFSQRGVKALENFREV